MKRAKNKPKNEPVGYLKFVRPLLVGCGVGAAVCAVILMALALAMSIKDLPQSLVEPLAVFAVALGAFCGGFCSAKIVREKGLLLGICCGAVLFCVLAFFGVGGEGFGTAGLIRLAVIPLCGGVGGILGVNTRSRRK
ncbi:TIGR04086 family membrane protein [Merdimmobilis hominis]|uniref:TIGR04086 family membrane protein n=1 Tax=uncultured Anaerotruncus sp. TaxID=905011 RepID=A0A6N2S973_9FIRM|nr:TIGR04086 family membrane protein [Merdimmobilis hominis]MCD4836295.1 TIGR04086 family membrane protein [Merdimmobilis hominis]